jgi:hypothetical protein
VLILLSLLGVLSNLSRRLSLKAHPVHRSRKRSLHSLHSLPVCLREECEFSGTKTALELHTSTCLKRPIACPICNETHANPATLSEHLEAHGVVLCDHDRVFITPAEGSLIMSVANNFIFVNIQVREGTRSIQFILLDHVDPVLYLEFRFKVVLKKGMRKLKYCGTVESIDTADLDAFPVTIQEAYYQKFGPHEGDEVKITLFEPCLSDSESDDAESTIFTTLN